MASKYKAEMRVLQTVVYWIPAVQGIGMPFRDDAACAEQASAISSLDKLSARVRSRQSDALLTLARFRDDLAL